MDINQEALAAYRRGLAMEAEYGRVLKGLSDDELDERRVAAELKKLARVLAGCSDQTLRLIEVQYLWNKESPWQLARYVADAQEQIKHRGGAPIRHSHREAVAVLSKHYPGPHVKVRGAKTNLTKARKGYYAFNPFVRWLGEQLLRIEDEALPEGERRMSLDEACLAAWKAVPTTPR